MSDYPRAIDEASEPEAVVARLPHYAPAFDHLVDMRTKVEIESYRGGGMRPAASIPRPLLQLLIAVVPDFLSNRELFQRWLTRHPQYRKVAR